MKPADLRLLYYFNCKSGVCDALHPIGILRWPRFFFSGGPLGPLRVEGPAFDFFKSSDFQLQTFANLGSQSIIYARSNTSGPWQCVKLAKVTLQDPSDMFDGLDFEPTTRVPGEVNLVSWGFIAQPSMDREPYETVSSP